MPIHLTWFAVGIRLICTVIAAAFIGMNRSEHGRPAGLRTCVLVCLAASIAMIQANLLLSLAGRAPDSFVMNDLMRLPLGILSGMGFIGAGAIIRRDNLVLGVTTAATMWFLTVVGLCFGGGQITLGFAGAVLGELTLTGLKKVEEKMKIDRQGRLELVIDPAGPGEAEIRGILRGGGITILSCSFRASSGSENRELIWQVQWRARPDQTATPESIGQIAAFVGVTSISWTPQSS